MPIRAMEQADIYDVFLLYQDIDSIINSWSLTPFFSLERFQSYFNHSQCNFVYCNDSGTPKAHLMITMPHNPQYQSMVTFGITVAKECRGQGIGHQLLKYLFQQVKQWYAVERIELEVSADNTGARRLYEQFGFTAEGVKKKAVYTDGKFVDVVIMAKYLPNDN
ncbi:GNAT family N-acetyltransferase [Veronia pacifica]|uniref:N-acetyltransferase domain-containing protein n=1 Tax=Veronia pacifica TaxID=1080227 RepID=A0A1C3EAS5_9GAMM|nr:GNAT family N-acetyltransferase [Veronia pacifica]ODA30300.1 hypothetical protein A8L45_20435 [Veronia pacifica]